jgi:mono/diheme cytochrome c family protein
MENERNGYSMRTKRRWFTTLFLLMGFAIIPATGLRADAPDAEPLFQQKCAMCHGRDGKGMSAIKTPDWTDPKTQASITDTEMKEIILNGKKGTPMPAFKDKLKDEEIDGLIKFLRSLNSQKKN